MIGSGPSAFYACDALLKAPELAVRVDMLDRLPTPYGLVRGGVAPDHPKIKSVVKVYEKIAADSRLRFFGNVKLGRDVQVEDLTPMQAARLILAALREAEENTATAGAGACPRGERAECHCGARNQC